MRIFKLNPELNFILLTFIGWRLGLLFITFLGLSTLPHWVSNGSLNWPNNQMEYWIRWANWDGGHFKGIAEVGYAPVQSVFLPLYPLLIRFLMFFNLSSLASSLIISHLATLGALYFLFKLAREDYSLEQSKKVVLTLLIFPTSFYLLSVYSESLFLFSALGSFYFARKKHWGYASMLASLCAISRISGLLIILALFIEYFFQDKKINLRVIIKHQLGRLTLYLFGFYILLNLISSLVINLKHWYMAGIINTTANYLLIFAGIAFLALLFLLIYKNISRIQLFNINFLFLLLTVIPYFIYVLYQMKLTDSNTIFVQNYSAWKLNLTLPWETVWGYINHLIKFNFFTLGSTARTLNELLFFLMLLITFIIAVWKKFRPSYLVYFFLALILTPISGTLVGIPRHAMVIFPIYFIFADIKNDYLKYGLIFVSILCLALFSILHINNFWIS